MVHVLYSKCEQIGHTNHSGTANILGTNTGKENIALACEYVVFIVLVEVSGLKVNAWSQIWG